MQTIDLAGKIELLSILNDYGIANYKIINANFPCFVSLMCFSPKEDVLKTAKILYFYRILLAIMRYFCYNY